MNDFIKALCDTAEKYKDCPAVADKNGSRITSYAEFFGMCLKTASWLRNKNLPTNSFIPVLLDSSAEYAAAVVGIWLSGCAAVPLGKNFPQERINLILTDCKAPLVIDDNSMMEILS
ncbi:MAG: AMP-binding protein, partial [Ruminococcus sp.]|nr:AMP-binding protein [Ruminococcus sp.]